MNEGPDKEAAEPGTTSSSGATLVVLDDDPTGTQTVHGVAVLTEWAVETLRREFDVSPRGFYVLTNSRSLGEASAKLLNHNVARNLRLAAAGRSFIVVSRSDSTLRGHFPAETDVLQAELGPFDAILLIPYFGAGSRYTIGDVHYLKEGARLTPVAETPFARDPTFGYRSSNLREWIEEKTKGRTKAGEVRSISLDELSKGREAVARKLLDLKDGQDCIVNAAQPSDLEVLVHALRLPESEGRRFLFRTAADFVAVRLGIRPQPLLSGPNLGLPPTGNGLWVVGSHVPGTTRQLVHFLETQRGIVPVELSVPRLFSDNREEELQECAERMNRGLASGRDVVMFTTREPTTGMDANESLQVARQVAEGVVCVVKGLKVQPRYVVGKGGITSSDVATLALGIKRAMVEGQILPGVPVWRAGKESRYPGLCYIVFPGNVGGPEGLSEVRSILSR